MRPKAWAHFTCFRVQLKWNFSWYSPHVVTIKCCTTWLFDEVPAAKEIEMVTMAWPRENMAPAASQTETVKKKNASLCACRRWYPKGPDQYQLQDSFDSAGNASGEVRSPVPVGGCLFVNPLVQQVPPESPNKRTKYLLYEEVGFLVICGNLFVGLIRCRHSTLTSTIMTISGGFSTYLYHGANGRARSTSACPFFGFA